MNSQINLKNQIYSIIILVLLMSSEVLDAQSFNFEEIKGIQSLGQFTESDLDYADVEGDMDLDIVISGYLLTGGIESTLLLLNDGDGNFQIDESNNFIPHIKGTVNFIDIDSDNDPDLLITGKTTIYSTVIYVNDGNGNFTLKNNILLEGVSSGSADCADIDNDNDIDFVISGYSTSGRVTYMYKNDGLGNFTKVNVELYGVSNSCTVFQDIDNDSDQDLILTGIRLSNTKLETYIYKNDGTGIFELDENQDIIGVKNGDISFSDVDGDNDIDLLISGNSNYRYSSPDRISKLYKNNGSGQFFSNFSFPAGFEYCNTSFCDIDNDNDPDILIRGERSTNIRTSILYENDGNGNYSINNTSNIDEIVRGDFCFADFNSDNHPDLFLSGGTSSTIQSNLYINIGEGIFNKNLINQLPNLYSIDIVFSDLNNDNFDDLIISGGISAFSKYVTLLYENTGQNTFKLLTDVALPSVTRASVAVEDVDGDDKNDILITGETEEQPIAELYMNKGNFIFEKKADQPFLGVYNSKVAFADIDNDNDPDLLITGDNYNSDNNPRLYKNDGNANFSFFPSPFFNSKKGEINFLDIDNDNDLDLLLSGNSKTKFYMNIEEGYFAEYDLPIFDELSNTKIEYSDFDNDNDKDLIVVNSDLRYNSDLLLNNGNCMLEQIPETDIKQFSQADVIANDFNFDGLDDLIFSGNPYSNSEEYSTELYENIGNNNFKLVENSNFINVNESKLYLTDINGDSKMDVCVYGKNADGAQIKFYLNKTQVGIKEIATPLKVKIYPNPVKNYIYIENLFSYFNGRIELINSQGIIIEKIKIKSPSVKKLLINESAGIYFLKIVNSDGLYEVKKIIKE